MKYINMSVASLTTSGSVVGQGFQGIDLVLAAGTAADVVSYTYKITELGGMRSLEAALVIGGTTSGITFTVPRSKNFLAGNIAVLGSCSQAGGAIVAIEDTKTISVPLTAGATSVSVSIIYPYV